MCEVVLISHYLDLLQNVMTSTVIELTIQIRGLGPDRFTKDNLFAGAARSQRRLGITQRWQYQEYGLEELTRPAYAGGEPGY